MAHADVIDVLSESAIVQLRTDLRDVLHRLTEHLRRLLNGAKRADNGGLADDPVNLELAAKLGQGFAGILREAGYDRALGRVLATFERLTAANAGYIEDQLGASFSSPNLRSLSRLAEGSIDDLLQRGGDAGARLREILVVGAHTNAPIADLVEKLAEAAGVTLNQAIVEAQTSLMAFHRDSIAVESFDAGIDLYEYTGPEDGNTRPFCDPLVDTIVTLQDLDEMDNGENQPKPVSRYLGGYRCRHSLSPISLEEAQARYESEGRSCIGPGCTLALQIVTGKRTGPAAAAFLDRNLGEYVRGRVVRRKVA